MNGRYVDQHHREILEEEREERRLQGEGVTFLDPVVFWMTLIQTLILIDINQLISKLGFASKQYTSS